MNLVVDMNLAPRWVTVLEQAGFSATHWSNLVALDAPDSEILRYALEHDSVVLTHDLDFGAILATTHGQKPSVVQVRATESALMQLAVRLSPPCGKCRQSWRRVHC